jgi:hypothetical protein
MIEELEDVILTCDLRCRRSTARQAEGTSASPNFPL